MAIPWRLPSSSQEATQVICSSRPLSFARSPSAFAQHLHLHLNKARFIRNSEFIQVNSLLGFGLLSSSSSSSHPLPHITWNSRGGRFAVFQASGDGHDSLGEATEKKPIEDELPAGSFRGTITGDGNGNGLETVNGNIDDIEKEVEEELTGKFEETEGLSMKKTDIEFGRFSFSQRDMKIAAWAAMVVLFSVANRLLYKMALIPMKEYPFFLALFNTFG